MNKAEWSQFTVIVMGARRRREAAGGQPSRLDYEDRLRQVHYRIMETAFQDMGFQGFEIGGNALAGDNEFRKLGRALDAIEYLQGDCFEFDCKAVGADPERWRTMASGRVKQIRKRAREIGLLPPFDKQNANKPDKQRNSHDAPV